MFETSLGLVVTDWAAEENLDNDYWKVWAPLKRYFPNGVL